MQKIFQEYGGVITTAMAIVALISLIGLLFTPGGTGWMDGAFKDVIEDFGDKVEEAVPGGRQWEDRIWVAFGTSITATNNTGAPDGTSTGKYTSYLEDWSGMQLTNLGVSGGKISGHVLYYVDFYANDLSSNDITRETVRFADLVTIEGSVNDFASGVPLGNVGDTVPYISGAGDSTVEDYLVAKFGASTSGTFAGACYQTFKTLQEAAPRATIVYITDNTGLHIASTGANYTADKTNNLGLTQGDYINTAMAVAENMGITVIDAGAVISEETPEYLIDHIHHTEAGGERYAKEMWKRLAGMYPTNPVLTSFSGNYFDPSASDIEYGGIYLTNGTWYANTNFFETGYIKIPINEELCLFGVDNATHWCYYDIDTKEYIRGGNGAPVDGRIYIGAPWEWLKGRGYFKDYVYIRIGLPKAAMDDTVITHNKDGIIE